MIPCHFIDQICHNMNLRFDNRGGFLIQLQKCLFCILQDFPDQVLEDRDFLFTGI